MARFLQHLVARVLAPPQVSKHPQQVLFDAGPDSDFDREDTTDDPSIARAARAKIAPGPIHTAPDLEVRPPPFSTAFERSPGPSPVPPDSRRSSGHADQPSFRHEGSAPETGNAGNVPPDTPPARKLPEPGATLPSPRATDRSVSESRPALGDRSMRRGDGSAESESRSRAGFAASVAEENIGRRGGRAEPVAAVPPPRAPVPRPAPVSRAAAEPRPAVSPNPRRTVDRGPLLPPRIPAEGIWPQRGTEQAGGSGSAVHVTIGTVEIRAVAAAPAQRPGRPAAATRPGLSLSRYLAQRDGQRR